MAWCGDLRVDHGQKHDPGDEIIIQRDLTNEGPLQKHYLILYAPILDGPDIAHLLRQQEIARPVRTDDMRSTASIKIAQQIRGRPNFCDVQTARRAAFLKKS